MTFKELWLAETPDLDIDDYIDAWHESVEDSMLHEYLGMSWDEYCHWVETGEVKWMTPHAS